MAAVSVAAEVAAGVSAVAAAVNATAHVRRRAKVAATHRARAHATMPEKGSVTGNARAATAATRATRMHQAPRPQPSAATHAETPRLRAPRQRVRIKPECPHQASSTRFLTPTHWALTATELAAAAAAAAVAAIVATAHKVLMVKPTAALHSRWSMLTPGL